MIYDTEKFESERTLTTEVCIIGSGPAGLVLADTIAKKSNKRISIMESGSFKMEKETESLSHGTKSGIIDENLEELHARRIGGTANHWILKLADKSNGFRYAELDTIDFMERDYIPYSGWPISKEDLLPFYRGAKEIYCDLGGDSSLWENRSVDTSLGTKTFAFGPTSVFTEALPSKFTSSSQTDIYTHANVTRLLCKDGCITAIQIKTLSGKKFLMTAETFIIAGGGFDTPKLLLQSNIGNEHDVVGRYYIDHSLIIDGYFYPEDLSILKSHAYLDRRLVKGKNTMRFFSFNRKYLLENHIPNCATMLFPKPGELAMKGHQSALRLIECVFRRRQMPTYRGFFADIINIMKAIPYLVRLAYMRFFMDAALMPGLATGGWSKISDLSKTFKRVEVMSLVEQYPHPENRVTLTDQRDQLGTQKIHVNLQWHNEQLEEVRRGGELIMEAIQTAIPDIGKYQRPDEEDEFYSNTAHHLMGTTRMGSDVRTSVVDKDCKVHNVDNLYIAGSSVFPTGGFANPTLTILALGIRLGEHIALLDRREDRIARCNKLVLSKS